MRLIAIGKKTISTILVLSIFIWVNPVFAATKKDDPFKKISSFGRVYQKLQQPLTRKPNSDINKVYSGKAFVSANTGKVAKNNPRSVTNKAAFGNVTGGGKGKASISAKTGKIGIAGFGNKMNGKNNPRSILGKTTGIAKIGAATNKGMAMKAAGISGIDKRAFEGDEGIDLFADIRMGK